MRISEGTVYHLKDEYFDLVKDCGVKGKSPDGRTYPALCCFNDKLNSLYWMIPMSTNLEKYQAVIDKEIARYGRSYSIVIGEYDNKKVAFQIQGMFPVAKKHILHVHTRMGRKVPVDPSITEQIKLNFEKIRKLDKKGVKCTLTDTRRIIQRIVSSENL